MAAMNWEFDQEVGILKNHVISNELLVQSVGATKILPFTTPIEGFGLHMGQTVNIMHVKELPDALSSQLSTTDLRIPIRKAEFGNRAITVVPWGEGVEYDDLIKDFGKFDIQNVLQKLLMRQMMRAMDTASATAFQDPATVLVCAIPTSATGITFETDGVPTATAISNLTFAHVGVIADYLAGNLHVPPYEGEDYIGLSCRKTLRGLKNDELWQAVHMYLRQGDLFYRGEVGKTENIRWVEVHREAALSNTAGSSTVLGEAIVFGDEAVARVEVEAPHLRANPNYQGQFGLIHAAAWYGKLAYGSFWPTANDGEAKIIRITSA